MMPTQLDERKQAVVLGVMSDTHGNRFLMLQAADIMKQLGATRVFHLGDDYSDAQELAMSGLDVHKVPGLWCAAYRDSRVPKRIVEVVDGVSIAAAHAPKDLRHSEHSADIVLTGHTHASAIEHVGHAIYLNPGHLKSSQSRGQRPSFAMITITAKEIHAAIHELTGAVRFERTFRRD
ncbi:MAG: metallophosphoesterase family protein [Candidatus Hydrogenedentales bacterium]|jgi:predicted phosphodiesterase